MSVSIFDIRVKEDLTPYLQKIGSTKQAEGTLANPELVAKTLCNVFSADKLLEERVWQICLDTKNHPVAFFEVSHGTIDASVVTPAGIYRRALLSSAASIIIAHNHPSGSLEPSAEDLRITKAVSEAGKILGLHLRDHVIIGKRGGYYSFLEHNNI